MPLRITAEPQEGDDIVDKIQRYERTGEYLDIIQKLWRNYDSRFTMEEQIL